MKKTLTIICLVLTHQFLCSQELKKEDQNHIATLIDCIKSNQKEKLATLISYPLKREYPIPEVKNKQEFVTRYDEIFDATLKSIIVKSNPGKDWSAVGWRGIMLNQGEVWIDSDGKIIAVNYQSKAENRIKEKKMQSERTTLHVSIAKYKEPICIVETSKFRIRIDDLGNNNYRYASWPIGKSMGEKPDLIINKGKFIADGSGGNHRYEFKNASYIYEIAIIVLGEKGSPPALFTLYKGTKEVMSQAAVVVKE
jgi:hypothetical protein